jgi:hypothetical protein
VRDRGLRYDYLDDAFRKLQSINLFLRPRTSFLGAECKNDVVPPFIQIE